jgi:hypothetical protein
MRSHTEAHIKGDVMRFSQLTKEQILRALSESHMAIANLSRYQSFLATGEGLPKSDAARIELMISNTKLIEKIQEEIADLDKELSSRGERI